MDANERADERLTQNRARRFRTFRPKVHHVGLGFRAVDLMAFDRWISVTKLGRLIVHVLWYRTSWSRGKGINAHTEQVQNPDMVR